MARGTPNPSTSSCSSQGGGSPTKAFLVSRPTPRSTHDACSPSSRETSADSGHRRLPPYHLAIGIGGTSAELTMKTVKACSTKYYDNLPTQGVGRRPRLRALDMSTSAGDDAIARRRGAVRRQYFCHTCGVIRLPRHGAALADRARRVVLRGPPGHGQDHATAFLRSLSTIRRSICRTSDGLISAARSSRST